MIHLDRYLLLSLLICAASPAAAVPAFPGAEGCGANATGGRGGSVYYVTTLADSGAGSLRTGVGVGNRTILFKVSGTIELLSDLKITQPNITVAGQTAPGDGITLKGRTFAVQNTRNVIVRYVRCRAGDVSSTFQGDSFDVVNGTNVMVDHLSCSWSVDECLSVTHSTNVTVQWCMISESLNNSQHEKGTHGYGSLLRYGAGALTFHHNLYQHHNSRNPRLGDRIKLDFVNNVIYNWGGTAGYSGDSADLADNPGGFTNYLNYIGNYLVAGPRTTSPTIAFKSGETNTVIYQSGNWIDSDKDTLLDGANTGWGMFGSYRYTPATNPYPLPAITTNPAAVAYQRVLAFAGASQVRDATDYRLLATVRNHNGQLVDAVGPADQPSDYVTNMIDGINYVFVRGWPTLNSTTAPADTDNDGIPDYWEETVGWNRLAANNNHTNSDGYTDLEWYLNWLADRHAAGAINTTLNVDLRALSGGYTNLVFAVADGTNGSVSLAGDGYTAQFVPATDFIGLAGFTFTASNTVDQASLGLTPVAVLVTNAPPGPNTPPVLTPVPDAEVIAGATLAFTNSATDAEQPAGSLRFTLLNAVPGALLGTNNGVFSWRPTMAQAPATNVMGIVATDTGAPPLSATQFFAVTVNLPAQPVLAGSVSNGQFRFVIGGDAGPDYTVAASTNLVDWDIVFTTNSPALPFAWTDAETGIQPQRFFRLQLGP